MTTFEDVLRILGILARALGMIAFGITSGWFTWQAFNQAEEGWQLKAIVFAVFFLFIALLARYTSPGGLGGYLLGAAGAFLFWGMIDRKGTDQEE